MEPSTPANGPSQTETEMASEMAMALKSGLMVQDMKAIGKQTRLTDKENLFMQTETFTKANG